MDATNPQPFPSADRETPPQTIPIIEEVAHVRKEVVDTGQVTVRKTVHNETQTVNVPVRHEEVSVEHVPINRYVDEAPAVRHEGDTMIIPVFREEIVVTKRLLLVEEVHVRKQVVTTNATHEIELRREAISAERVPLSPTPPLDPPR